MDTSGLVYWNFPLCFFSCFPSRRFPISFHQLDRSSRHDRIRSSVTLLVITRLRISTAFIYKYLSIYLSIH